MFEIVTLFEAVLPTFTSPKSIVDGFSKTSVAVGLVDENARESEPHPDNPRQSESDEAARTAAAALRFLRIDPAFWAISGHMAAFVENEATNE